MQASRMILVRARYLQTTRFYQPRREKVLPGTHYIQNNIRRAFFVIEIFLALHRFPGDLEV